MILDPDNQVIVSAVAVWEIAIKVNLGKLLIPLPADAWIGSMPAAHRLELLPVQNEHVFRTFGLPMHHRMLVTQCLSENLPLITADKQLRSYPIEVIW